MTFKTFFAGAALAALTLTATTAPAGGLADDVAEQETIVSTQGAAAGISTWLIPALVVGLIVIAQSRDDVMRRLVANGLLDLNKRHVLSPIPLRVGVATSVDSAAWAVEKLGVTEKLLAIDSFILALDAEALTLVE